MSELDNDAWPQDATLPQGDGPALDDQAALAFEIAAMRVRASWDELDAPAEAPAPTALGALPIDPFAPFSAPAQVAAQAPWSAPPPAQPALIPPPSVPPPAPAAQDPFAPAVALPSAAETSPSSAVDTAPMAFLLATPAAVAGAPKQPTSSFDESTSAPAFLPGNKLASPKTIAIAVASVVLAGALWLMGGDDAPAEAGQGAAPSSPSAVSVPPPRVEAVLAAPSPGAAPALPAPGERLAVAPSPPASASHEQAERPLAATPTAILEQRAAVAPAARNEEPDARREAKAADARRNKRAPTPSAQSRAQRHESVASVKPAKRKSSAESPRPSAPVESPKRKGTGFVSANPY